MKGWISRQAPPCRWLFTPTGNFGQITEHLSTSALTTVTFSFSKPQSSLYLPCRRSGITCITHITETEGSAYWKGLESRTYSSTWPPQWSTSASSNCPATTGAMSTSIPSENRAANTTQHRTQEGDVNTAKGAGALCWQEMARTGNSSAEPLQGSKETLMCSQVCGFVPAPSVGHWEPSLLPTTSSHPILLKWLKCQS